MFCLLSGCYKDMSVLRVPGIFDKPKYFEYTHYQTRVYDERRSCKWCWKGPGECFGRQDDACYNWEENFTNEYEGKTGAMMMKLLYTMRTTFSALDSFERGVFQCVLEYYIDFNDECRTDMGECGCYDHHMHPFCQFRVFFLPETTLEELKGNRDVKIEYTYRVTSLKDEQQQENENGHCHDQTEETEKNNTA